MLLGSNQAEYKCKVPRGSVLWPFSFLIYINDTPIPITDSEERHFADNTNLLNCTSCVWSINKQVNYDLKNLPKCPLILVNTSLCFLLFLKNDETLSWKLNWMEKISVWFSLSWCRNYSNWQKSNLETTG